MGKKKSLSEVQRAQKLALHGQNLSERLISKKVNKRGSEGPETCPTWEKSI